MVYEEGRLLDKHFEYNGRATNNYAEYRAMELALEWCRDNVKGADEADVKVYSDSELVVKQLNRMYKVRSKAMAHMNSRVSRLARSFHSVAFENVPRDNRGVSAVDRGLNELLDDIEAGRKAPQ